MEKNDVVVKIIEAVIDTKINDYTQNLFNLGLDSLGVLKLVTLIEDELKIEIDDNDLTIENMSSVNAVIKLVNKYYV